MSVVFRGLCAGVFLLMARLPVAGAQPAPPLHVYGGPELKTFLGCLSCGSLHEDSVWNRGSEFGFENRHGVWDPFHEFASPFSAYSMCNRFAAEPPVIVDDAGTAYGRLSVNEFQNGGVCNVSGPARLCRAVRAACASRN